MQVDILPRAGSTGGHTIESDPVRINMGLAGWSKVHRVLNQTGIGTKLANCTVLSRLAMTLSVMCAGSLLLVACGETANEEDRRFANDPSRDPQPTEVMQETEAPVATPTVQPLPSPDTLLRARGAPSTVYAILNGSIQSIRLAEGETTTGVIPPPDGARFVAIDSSPSGDRVAAVTISTDTSASSPRIDLHVFDSAGAELEAWPSVVTPESPAATPEQDTTESTGGNEVLMDWGAQGDRIIVASVTGQLASAALGGDVAAIDTPAEITEIRDVEWSPRGDSVAVLGVGDDNVARIGLVDPAEADPEFLVVAPIDEGGDQEHVREFSWLPDSSGLVYLSGTGNDIDAVGGQLFSLDLGTMSQRLVATAGQGGPSATISDFSVSPDGKAVAYTIVLPDGGTWRFNSLWVRSLRDQRALRMPVGDVIEVNAIWWVGEGVLWGQAVAEDGKINESFIRLSPGGDPTAILAVGVDGQSSGRDATPGATPMPATPVG